LHERQGVGCFNYEKETMSKDSKQEIEKQLATAQAELDSWKLQRFTREDGSPAQDRRFEERGDHLQERVSELAAQLEKMIASGA